MKRSRDDTEIASIEEASDIPPRIDAAINSLHDDELSKIFEILGNVSFRGAAGTCKRFHRVYKQVHPDCLTSAEDFVQSVSGALLFCKEANQSVFALSIEVPCIHHDAGTTSWRKLLNSCPFVTDLAALHGRLDILKSMRRIFGTDEFNSIRIGALAAMNGHLHVLRWLDRRTSMWSANPSPALARLAAGKGQLKALEWARVTGYRWGSDTCAYAAAFGHLEVLQWARENSFEWNGNTTMAAAKFGQLATLQWARANGCPWHRKTIAIAAGNGHIDVVEWARANGCPG